MFFDLYAHRNAKRLVTSKTNRGPYVLPPGYRHDIIKVRLTVLDDNPTGGLTAPFSVVDVTPLSLKMAIGDLGKPNYFTQTTWEKDEAADTFTGLLNLGAPGIIQRIQNTQKDLQTLLSIRVSEGGNPETVIQIPFTIAREIISEGEAPELPSEQQPASDAIAGVMENSKSIAWNQYADREQAEVLTPRHPTPVIPVSARVDDLAHLGYRAIPVSFDVGAPDADFTISGLVAGADGQRITVTNATTRKITLASQHANSSAANRFKLVADIVLQPAESAEFRYDGTDARWTHTSPQVFLAAGKIPYADSQGRLTTTANFGVEDLGFGAAPGMRDGVFQMVNPDASVGTAQPSPIQLWAGFAWSGAASKLATMNVRFVPVDGSVNLDGTYWLGDLCFRSGTGTSNYARLSNRGAIALGYDCPTPRGAVHVYSTTPLESADSEAVLLENHFPGSGSGPSISPSVIWEGQARVTTGPVAKTAAMRARMVPADGASAVSGCVVWSSSVHTPAGSPSWADHFYFKTNGNYGIGVDPSARLHFPAGTASAGTAPMKLTTGTFLTTTEPGAGEYDGYHIWFSNHDGSSPLKRRALGRVHAEVLGNGTANVFTVTHGLNTKRLQRQVLEAATGEEIVARVEVVDRDTVKVTTYFVPASNALVLTLTACPNDSAN